MSETKHETSKAAWLTVLQHNNVEGYLPGQWRPFLSNKGIGTLRIMECGEKGDCFFWAVSRAINLNFGTTTDQGWVRRELADSISGTKLADGWWMEDSLFGRLSVSYAKQKGEPERKL